ncbi:MAG: DUF962 domain-containing protein [Chitinophagales bacterium]
MAEKQYTTFWAFYPFYLTQHARPINRTLHFVGTLLVIVCLVAALATGKGWLAALMPVCGYGFAWVGHFFLEKNRPATFTYPLYSLGSDFVMFWHTLTGRINQKVAEAHRQLGITNPWEA